MGSSMMHFDLAYEDAATLRDLLQRRVTELDSEIYATESLRFKDALRQDERQLERILRTLSEAMQSHSSAPGEWEPRDSVPDVPDSERR